MEAEITRAEQRIPSFMHVSDHQPAHARRTLAGSIAIVCNWQFFMHSAFLRCSALVNDHSA